MPPKEQGNEAGEKQFIRAYILAIKRNRANKVLRICCADRASNHLPESRNMRLHVFL